MKNSLKTITLISALSLAACGVKNPDLTSLEQKKVEPLPRISTNLTTSDFFPLVASQASFEQDPALTNTTTVMVGIERKGAGVTNFTKEDFILTENGKEITNFDFAIEDTKAEQVVDIAFVVDVTGTMTQFIESAKRALTNFVNSARQRGYHTRMCISTFGDYTVKKCDRFFDNNPRDGETMAQVEELLSEIAATRAFRGAGQDPGWPDYEENPMRALIDATEAPWRADAQKFVILASDESKGFLHTGMPGFEGVQGNIESTKGILPPTIGEVKDALDRSGVTVFAVTPDIPGYTRVFQGVPSIVEATQGEHFLFRNVIQRPQILDEILERIISRMESTYRLTYDAEQFDANHSTLALEDRKIDVNLRSQASSADQINSVRASAQYPDGRPAYKTEFKLSDKAVDARDMEVLVNDVPAAASDYQLVSGKLRFKAPPAANAKIKVNYYYQDLYANLRMKTLGLSRSLSLSGLKVSLNGVAADKKDYDAVRDLSGNISIRLLPTVTQGGDRYEIRKNQGLFLKVE